MKYKLFCDLTMEFYYVEAESLFEARKKLAMELGVTLDRIIIAT